MHRRCDESCPQQQPQQGYSAASLVGTAVQGMIERHTIGGYFVSLQAGDRVLRGVPCSVTNTPFAINFSFITFLCSSHEKHFINDIR